MSLPTVCTCGAVREGSGWWHREELPPLPHSHGACPACVDKYQAELARLGAKPFVRPAWFVPVGRSVLHPTDTDADGGARVVRGEP